MFLQVFMFLYFSTFFRRAGHSLMLKRKNGKKLKTKLESQFRRQQWLAEISSKRKKSEKNVSADSFFLNFFVASERAQSRRNPVIKRLEVRTARNSVEKKLPHVDDQKKTSLRRRCRHTRHAVVTLPQFRFLKLSQSSNASKFFHGKKFLS
jgi:hypothetical protein